MPLYNTFMLYLFNLCNSNKRYPLELNAFLLVQTKDVLKALKARETASRFKPYGKQNFTLRAWRG